MPDEDKRNGPRPWHAWDLERALDELGADREAGLSDEEAAGRLERHGPNRLPERKAKHPLLKFLHHYHNVLIYVLLVAAAGTALLGHWIDTYIILAVVLINGLIGFIQEGRAEKALAAVRGMLSLSAHVVRGGRAEERPAEEVVPGDLVQLKSGDRVPADMRLLSTRELRINEASLTGESEAVSKSVDPVAEDAALGDRRCMAYSGTLVVSGRGTGIVTATGEETELGRISRMLAGVSSLTTPLLRQVARFGRTLTVIILTIGAATFLIGRFVRGLELGELFLSVVGLAVAAIPEGLPAIMTIILAIGVQRMARRNAIIRRLPGVETLGSVSVICSDKTGTLTRGEMTVTAVALTGGDLSVSGAGYAPEGEFKAGSESIEAAEHPVLERLVTAAALCNDARLLQEDGEWSIEGSPTEGALLALAAKAGFDLEESNSSWSRLDEIPFESEHKFMATLHRGPDQRVVFLKGAPEQVLERCRRQQASEGEQPLEQGLWEEAEKRLASGGRRMLALAWREASGSEDKLSFETLGDDLVLLGLVGLQDPPREEAIAAVRECQEAGIRVKMITGDHALTASAIAAEIGIGEGGEAVTGSELDGISDEDLPGRVEEADVFARVSPEHKLRLVTALQKRGWITAMTGDGVNDAPALKKADIGIAMGIKGTEVSKEAAEMVLADDNFASIVHAVEEGRTVYDNLRKALLFMLPTNGGEALVIIAAILFGLALPITPAQILWINMITAVTLALALAFEPMEPDAMQRPPRRADESLTPPSLLLRIAYVSVLLTVTTLGIYAWAKGHGLEVEYARTLAVNMLIIGEVVYLFNSRLMTRRSLSRAGLKATPWVWGAAGVVVGLQMLFTYLPPMQRLFGVRPLAALHWGAIVGINLLFFLLVEAEKAFARRREKRRGLLLLLLPAFLAACLPAPRATDPGVPATHYDIRAEIDPGAGSLEVAAVLTFAAPPGDTAALDLLLHRELAVRGVSGDLVAGFRFDSIPGGASIYAPEAWRLGVDFIEPPGEDSALRLSFEYSGRITSWPPWSPNVLTRDWVELGLYLPWFPVCDELGLFTYKLDIGCPDGYEVRTAVKGRRAGGRWIFEQHRPGRDIVVVASPDLRTRTFEDDGRAIHIHAVWLREETMELIGGDLTFLLGLLRDWFGDPGSASLTVIQSPREKGGGYTRNGLVVLGGLEDADYAERREGYVRYLAHEAAHIWWWRAPVETWEDWLNEGLAEYSALAAVREIFDREAFERRLAAKERQAATAGALWGFDRADISSHEARERTEVLLYSRAPVLLFELERRLGPGGMRDFCRELFERQAASTEELLAVLERRAGAAERERFEAGLKSAD